MGFDHGSYLFCCTLICTLGSYTDGLYSIIISHPTLVMQPEIVQADMSSATVRKEDCALLPPIDKGYMMQRHDYDKC